MKYKKKSVEDQIYRESLIIIKKFLEAKGHSVALSRREEMIKLFFKEKYNEDISNVTNYRKLILEKMKEEHPDEVKEIRSRIRQEKKEYLDKKYGHK